MVTPITQLPVAPSRQRPEDFSDEADAFLGALPNFGNQANTLAAEVNALALNVDSVNNNVTILAGQASNSANSANQSKLAAAQSEANALAYAQAAGASAGIPTPVPDKYLHTNSSGAVEWASAPSDPLKLNASSGLATNIGQTYLDKGDVAAAGTVTFDVKAASVQRARALGNLTVIINNWSTDGRSETLELHCVNFGGKTVVWPAGFWIKNDGSYVSAVGNSGITWQVSGTDRVMVMRDAGTVYYKVMR